MSSRMVIGALLTTLLLGTGAWVTWAQKVAQKPSEAKVIELIETHSPYNVDRRHIEDQSLHIGKLDESVQELTGDVIEVQTLLMGLSKQIDKLEFMCGSP